jgi:hypothetical protein
MHREGSFWEPESPDPGAEIGPPVTEDEVHAWEQKRGVKLPEVLKQAYGQQSGGYVLGTDICLLPLHEVEPVEEGYEDYFYEDDRPRFDFARLYYLGSDADGSTLLLYYSAEEPEVYAHWSDGGTIERRSATTAELLGSS